MENNKKTLNKIKELVYTVSVLSNPMKYVEAIAKIKQLLQVSDNCENGQTINKKYENDAFQTGTHRDGTIRKQEKCSECNGRGYNKVSLFKYAPDEVCTECNGTGITNPAYKQEDEYEWICDVCFRKCKIRGEIITDKIECVNKTKKLNTNWQPINKEQKERS